jgi:hypothetical protein
MPSSKRHSDLAEIFSMLLLIQTNILFHTGLFISHHSKALNNIVFLFLENLLHALFKKLFHISVLGFSLMAQGLIMAEIIQISLILFEI